MDKIIAPCRRSMIVGRRKLALKIGSDVVLRIRIHTSSEGREKRQRRWSVASGQWRAVNCGSDQISSTMSKHFSSLSFLPMPYQNQTPTKDIGPIQHSCVQHCISVSDIANPAEHSDGYDADATCGAKKLDSEGNAARHVYITIPY